MSRLKGADLGVVNPTLASLGIAGALNFRGAYDTAANYAVNDVVIYQGIAYRAKTPSGTGTAAPLTGETTGQAASGATSGTFTVPATANVGDIAYVILSGWSASQALTITGWTSTIAYVQVSGNSDGVWLAVYRKVLTASDIGATVNMSWSFSDYVAYTCRTYYGLHDVASAAASNTLTTPSITPTVYPSTVVSCVSVGASVGSTVDVAVTAPAGTSNYYAGIRVAGGGHNNHFAATADESVASGASTARAFGATPLASISYIAGAFAVKPNAGAFVAGLWTPLGPTAPLNYRGNWTSTPSPAYAVNDVVLRNSVPYSAIAVPGSTDPVGGVLALGAVSGGTQVGGFSGNVPIAQPFTVSSPINVSQVRQLMSGGGTVSGRLVGIASSITAGTITWLANGTSGSATNGTYLTVALSSTVTLVPGVTYYFVTNEPWVAVATSGGVTSGVVQTSTSAPITYGASFATTAPAADQLIFELDGNPWQTLSPATAPLNYRGPWSTTPLSAYAVNDVVLRNGAAYAAIATPGATDPVAVVADAVAGATNSGSSTLNVGAASAQGFTVNAPTVVRSISVWCHAAHTFTPGSDAGIASDFNTTATVPWLGRGQVPAASGNSWAVVVLDQPVLLVPGVTYRLVCTDASLGAVTAAPTPIGVVATLPNVWTGATYNSQSTTFWTVFRLNTAGNPWQQLSPITEEVNFVAASGSAVTLPDVTVATMHRVTLTAATTITLPTPGAGKRIRVLTVQDATGGRTLAWATPSGAVKWPGGTAPVVTATANAIDGVEFYCIDGANWLGRDMGRAFA